MATSNKDILTEFFDRVIEGLKADAESKGQKFPGDKMRSENDDYGGRLIGPHYVQYLIFGRGPGKQPPPEAMTAFVDSNPDILKRAQAVYGRITSQQLGFLIGRKIAREGTDIYSGKRPGIDLLGTIDKSLPDLVKTIAKNEALRIATDLFSTTKNKTKVTV
jgi:hypothetical protein